MAEFTETIFGICAITKGSFVKPTSRMSTEGLLFTNLYLHVTRSLHAHVFSVPITKHVDEQPVSRGFFPSSPHATPTNSLVMAPDSIRSIMPSLNISL